MPPKRQLDDVACYLVGWIAPLLNEQTAAIASLDEEHGRPKNFERPSEDPNAYTWGCIKGHNIVIVSLGATVYGTVNASIVATRMRLALPHLRVGLLVGIGAGLNVKRSDIRLGDVVVSKPGEKDGGVIQYDLTKNGLGAPERIGFLSAPPQALLQALGGVHSRHLMEDSKMHDIIQGILDRWPKLRENGFTHPGIEYDRLFESSNDHITGNEDCQGCDSDAVIERPLRSHPFTPRIHYGTIASGNRLVKSAREREILISQLSDTCLCLEMEAAGVMNTFPCLVIRGICDYADTHKNDAWQNYAAITATAFASELLGHLDIGEVKSTKPIRMMDVKEVIKEEFGPVNEHIHDNKRRQIEHWISPEDQDTRHRDVHASRQEGTGDWFLQNLDAWTHTPGARQWCLGPAGAGKTVLASSIINHLRHMNASSPRKVLFYYFDYQKKDGHKADRFCGNLLKQLSMQSEQLLSSLRIAHERSIYPEKGEMFVKFIQETEKAGKVYIVVDALDECFSDHGSAADVLGLLRRLPKNVSWLITARKTPETQKMTQPERGFYLIESNEGDIARFLHKMVSNEQGFQEMLVNTPGLEDEIRISVIQNSNSNFLLAKLQITMVLASDTVVYVRRVLRELPIDLKGAYEKTYEMIKSRGTHFLSGAIRALIWVVHARRPLSRTEFKHALAIEQGLTKDELDQQREDVVISWCVGLIVVDEQSQVVRLIHETARAYLSEKLDNAGMAVSRVAKACMSFVKLPIEITASNYVSETQTYPFLAYCARHWGDHVFDSKADTEVLAAAMELLRDKTALSRSVNVVALPWKAGALEVQDAAWYEESVHPLFVSATPACVAAYFGLVECLEELWHEDNLIVAEGLCSQRRGPLHYSAANGHHQAVEWLISHRADVDLQDIHGVRPLHLAAYDGSEKVLLALLKANPNIHARTTHYDWRSDLTYSQPLHWATVAHKSGAAKLLIENGADYNATNAWFRTPLHLAARHSLLQVMRVLLDAGADIEAERDGRLTPLIWAAENNHVDTVELLLQRQAKMNKSSFCGTPVEWAFRHDRIRLREVLLPLGQLDHNLEALKFAMTQALGRRELNEIEEGTLVRLLEAAADIDSTVSGRTAQISRGALLDELLVYVLTLPNFESVSTLVRLGARLSTVDKQQRTFLHMSLHWNRIDWFNQGLSCGLGHRTKDKQGCEPLHHAASGGCLQGVRNLLESGVEVDVVDHQKWTALHWASYCGHEEVVAYLIKKDCSREATDQQGQTALDVALAIRPGQRHLLNLLGENTAERIESRLQQATMGEASWWLCVFETSSESTSGLEHELQWDKDGVRLINQFCDFPYGACCNERWSRVWSESTDKLRDGLRSFSAIYDYRQETDDGSWDTISTLAFCKICSYPTFGARFRCISDPELNLCMRCYMDRDIFGYNDLEFTNVYLQSRVMDLFNSMESEEDRFVFLEYLRDKMIAEGETDEDTDSSVD